jgi:hypothetical protein
MLGFTGREARLAGRVREMEEQNQLLRRQLSISQSHLVAAMRTSNHTATQNLVQPTHDHPGRCPNQVCGQFLCTYVGQTSCHHKLSHLLCHLIEVCAVRKSIMVNDSCKFSFSWIRGPSRALEDEGTSLLESLRISNHATPVATQTT